MHKILILGPQGSGKGTQANILAEKLGVPALSMGGLLRDEASSGSEMGTEIGAFQARGELVPDDVALKVLQKRLKQGDAVGGYILDGYPRNMAQYETYHGFDTPTDIVLITVPNEVSIDRTMKRGALEGRNDDTRELIERRLAIYEQDTKPVIDRYRSAGVRVHDIEGLGTIDEIAQRIEEALDL